MNNIDYDEDNSAWYRRAEKYRLSHKYSPECGCQLCEPPQEEESDDDTTD
jgi:hypothetical protein